MVFTASQASQAIASIDEARKRLQDAKSTLQSNPAASVSITTDIRDAVNKCMDALLFCGAALED